MPSSKTLLLPRGPSGPPFSTPASAFCVACPAWISRPKSYSNAARKGAEKVAESIPSATPALGIQGDLFIVHFFEPLRFSSLSPQRTVSSDRRGARVGQSAAHSARIDRSRSRERYELAARDDLFLFFLSFSLLRLCSSSKRRSLHFFFVFFLFHLDHPRSPQQPCRPTATSSTPLPRNSTPTGRALVAEAAAASVERREKM